MKKFANILIAAICLLVVVAPISTAVAHMAVHNPAFAIAGAAGIVLLVTFVKTPKINAFTSGIQKEIWENDIVSNLYKNNEFLTHAVSADQYVMKGKVVHIPQAGAAPDVVKNRTDKPATASTRTDTDITYNLDEFTSDPIHIPNADTVELSYDKRASVTAEAQAKLREVVAENMLINWAAPAANVIKTTGAATVATAPNATGNRKLIVIADLKSAMTAMNKKNIPMENRFALFSANMYDQFIESLTATQYRDFSQYFDATTGVLGRLYGFNIMMRSTTAVYDTNYAVKAYGAAGVTTDNEAVACWQQNSVERALGDVKFFEKKGDPQWYGDIYSFLVRMGGRVRRSDNAGVVAIAQDTAA